MKNVILQSLGLDLVNINVCATVCQNIPLNLRDRAIFTFSEFGAPSWKLLHIKVNPDLHLTYSENGGNVGLVLKMKNIACISIFLTKHVIYIYLYLFKFVSYCIVAFKAN